MTVSQPSSQTTNNATREVALFVPCYVDQLFPGIGRATLQVLEACGCCVHFDPRQTCCGQPLANSGCTRDAAQLARRHLEIFRGMTTVVPSGSCTAMIRHHFHDLELDLSAEDHTTMARTRELSEFLVDDLGISDVGARFPHRVAIHQSCHYLRELGQGGMSEAGSDAPAASERLLRAVQDIDLCFPERRDECCGFGGTFAVNQATVSARMGCDRLQGLADTGADYMVSTDVSCLMHLDGLRRRGRPGPQPIHLAEILAHTTAAA